jgi:hypothetical protein
MTSSRAAGIDGLGFTAPIPSPQLLNIVNSTAHVSSFMMSPISPRQANEVALLVGVYLHLRDVYCGISPHYFVLATAC